MAEDPGFTFVGETFGNVFPPRPPVALPTIEARTAALRAFANYLATLRFMRPGFKGSPFPEEFRVKREDIHVEQPDGVVDLRFPSIAFLGGRGTYDWFRLGGPYLFDETYNCFGPGTVLAWAGDYVEDFTIECWASKKPERRAMIAGIEAAMLRSESSTATRFELTEFFGVVASYDLSQRELNEDEAVRNRRRAMLYVNLRVPVVELVNAVTLKPYVRVVVADTGLLAEIDP
jgi:hypothetical protein